MSERKTVLFLTNNENTKEVLDYLCRVEQSVKIFQQSLNVEELEKIRPYYIVSYNYKYIIKQEVIDYMKGNIINLHISYLPWNRGANPNFWGFLEDTPKGITIHYVNKDLDKGRIIVQREVQLDEKNETFESSYRKLNKEIVELFKENWPGIRENKLEAYDSQGKGSYHSLESFQRLYHQHPFEWKENIYQVKQRIRKNI